VRDTPLATLDPARWRRIRELFDDIVEHDPAERLARLEAACAGDLELFREVRSLLDHDDRAAQDPRAGQDPIQGILAEAARDAVAARDGTRPVPPAIGRYRILHKLGEGGMGEVFVAEDTSLGRRVALKLPAASLADDSGVRERLQREARAAATLNHPHVCVVHEVGEGPDGQPFIAMEYLEGETLAERLARGRLPFAEVIALGHQAADALAHAHARGVVHRDLKPSNIMLTPRGIKLMDFGLASLARDLEMADAPDTAAFMGTIRYMSPEQARGEPLDHRTDLFSLGIVLYEAATGRLPFDGDTPRAARTATLEATPAPPSRLAASLPAAFDRVIARALAKRRDERYGDATELGAALASLASGMRRPWGMTGMAGGMAWAIAAAALVVMVTYAVIAGLPGPRPAGRVHAKQTILVGGFTNTTGDPSFDGTLRVALMVQLQQTPFVTVFPDASVRETLRLMARPPDEPLSPAVAKEIAVRRGIPVMIAGSIAKLGDRGDRYVITLMATDSRSEGTLARERVEVADKAAVLPGLGRAILQFRRTLGESAPTIEQFSTPIERATTASLDALKAYTLGVEQSRRGDYPTALSLFQRAVQIDPDFAMAHMALAREEYNSNHTGRVTSAAARAFALRGRVTAREQASITIFYHLTVTGDLDQAIAAALLSRRTYASEGRTSITLSDLYLSSGDHDKAAEAGREAVRLSPDVASAYSNLAGALYRLSRFEEAREVYRQAMSRGIDAPEYHVFLWRVASLAGDDEGMRAQIEWAAASSTWARNILARPAALQGRWREAQAKTAEAAAFFDARGMGGLAARAISYQAMDGALFGDCRAARQSVPRVLASAVEEEHAQAMLVLALCGEQDRAAQLADALQARRPFDTRITKIWLPSIRAAVALERGHPAQAIELLRVTAPYEGATEPWPVYVRGLALLRAGAGGEARAEFERILGNPGWSFWMPFTPVSHLGRARAAAMTGDVETAARAYQDFVALWRDADADLPVLVAARREYARLPLPR
jgi:eukaryotic-like serine/threonine-protein kinase